MVRRNKLQVLSTRVRTIIVKVGREQWQLPSPDRSYERPVGIQMTILCLESVVSTAICSSLSAIALLNTTLVLLTSRLTNARG